jgi:hypothetical protein
MGINEGINFIFICFIDTNILKNILEVQKIAEKLNVELYLNYS